MVAKIHPNYDSEESANNRHGLRSNLRGFRFIESTPAASGATSQLPSAVNRSCTLRLGLLRRHRRIFRFLSLWFFRLVRRKIFFVEIGDFHFRAELAIAAE